MNAIGKVCRQEALIFEYSKATYPSLYRQHCELGKVSRADIIPLPSTTFAPPMPTTAARNGNPGPAAPLSKSAADLALHHDGARPGHLGRGQCQAHTTL